MGPLWIAVGVTLLGIAGWLTARRMVRDVRAAAPAAAAPSPWTSIDGDLDLQVHEGHLRDGTGCWTFVSRGFARMKHPELVLSVARDPADVRDEVLAHALMLFRSFFVAVARGGRIAVWTTGELGGGLFDRPALRGFAIVPGIGPDDVALPDGALTILVLTDDEARLARIRGAASISSLLGHHYRHYPTGWWLERRRPSIATALAGKSLLAGTARPCPGLSTLQHARGATTLSPDPRAPGLASGLLHHVDPPVVTVDAGAGPTLLEVLRGLGPATAAIVATAPSPLAAGRLVWIPGEPRSAITGPAPGTSVTGSFIAFAFEAGDADLLGATVAEDGFVIMLDAAGRDALVTALETTSDLDVVPANPDRRWRLEHAVVDAGLN